MASQGSIMLSLTLLAMAMSAISVVTGDNNPGTTVHLQNIVIGRCYDYKQIRYKTILPQVEEDCETLYEKFLEGFSDMPPCSVRMSRYQPFMDAASQDLPENKVMFWSGVKELVHEYALDGQRYVTLEDTMIGYLVDSLVWCGQSKYPGINYTRCPSWSDCPTEASESFWAAASKTFAESARGSVTAMMDASNPLRPPYRRDSQGAIEDNLAGNMVSNGQINPMAAAHNFFGKFELPYLTKELVTEVKVLLTRPLDSPVIEDCKTGASMILLKEDVEARGMSFSCVDEPEAIIHLLCVANPNDRACTLASEYIFHHKSPYASEQDTHDKQQAQAFNAKPVDRFASTEKAEKVYK